MTNPDELAGLSASETTAHGPCRMCGATGYGLSYGGPDICPVCDTGGNNVAHWKQRAERAEAELAALKRRIAEAPIVLCEVKPEDETEDSGTFYLPRHLWNMTLALLPVGGDT